MENLFLTWKIQFLLGEKTIDPNSPWECDEHIHFGGYASVRPFLYFDLSTSTFCQIWTSYWSISTGRSKVGGSKYIKGRRYENGRSTGQVELMRTHFGFQYPGITRYSSGILNTRYPFPTLTHIFKVTF